MLLKWILQFQLTHWSVPDVMPMLLHLIEILAIPWHFLHLLHSFLGLEFFGFFTMSSKLIFLFLGFLFSKISNFSPFFDLVLKFSLIHKFSLLSLPLLLLDSLLVSLLGFLHRMEDVLILHGIPKCIGADKGISEFFLVAEDHVVVVLVVLFFCFFWLWVKSS